MGAWGGGVAVVWDSRLESEYFLFFLSAIVVLLK